MKGVFISYNMPEMFVTRPKPNKITCFGIIGFPFFQLF